jgi:hypothetical protein
MIVGEGDATGVELRHYRSTITSLLEPAGAQSIALPKVRGFDATPKAFVFNMLRSVSKVRPQSFRRVVGLP